MSLAVLFFSAALLGDDPAPFHTLVGEPAGGCDIALAFNFNPARKSIDLNTYRRTNRWIQKIGTRISKSEEIAWGNSWDGHGARTLCLTVASKEDIEPLFESLRDVLPKVATRATVTLQTRSGSRFENRFRQYPVGLLPRDNAR